MKTAILASIAFAAGLAGGTGTAYVRRDKTPAPAAVDSTAAASGAHDSSAVNPAARDSSAHEVPVHPVAEAAAPRDSTPALPSPPTLKTLPVIDSAASAKDLDAVGAAQSRPYAPDYPRLSKILTAMPPASAADLIGRLSDRDAEGIIRVLGQRQAAALMAALPKERAALLGKRLLVPADTGVVK